MADRPWLRSYPPAVPKTLEPYPERSVFAILEEAVAQWPDSPAVAFFGKRLTYKELMAEVERFSRVLASMGIQKGDRIAFVLPNCPQYVIAFFACQRLGAVVVGNNPLYTQREMTHQLNDAGTETVICLDQLYPLVNAVRGDTPIKRVLVTKITDYMPFPLKQLAPLKFKREAKHEGRPWPPVPADADVEWWADLMKGSYPEVPAATVNPKEDVAVLVYTGGTTGLSKGAMLSHHNVSCNTLQTASWFKEAITEGEGGIMCVLPFFHSYGLGAVMMVGLAQGLKLVLLPRFELDMALKAIAKEKPTLFPGVPRIYIAINESPETQKHDITSIKACFSGAAPLPVAVAEKFESITGGRLVEGYGLTETSPVTHINPIFGKRKFGSIGLPIPDTDCKLVDIDDPDKGVAGGEEGELCIAGPQVMMGYWNKPDETAEMIRKHADGRLWLHTGDIAKVDEEGYFSIVDRKKDMIIVSGFNVYPTDVEQILYRHPKVQKAAVVGIPDAKTGEAVKAFIVLKEGQDATPEEIMEWTRDEKHGLTGYRAPKHIEFREELPETLVGKVLRRVLIEEEKQKTAASG